MARYTGSKHKLARREGVNIIGKQSASLDRRINILPGAKSGSHRRGKQSEYGMQLREKQKLKRIYGLLEKQFRNYVESAQNKRMNTSDVLIQLLEARLDNIVYRLGYARSRSAARQLVSHGHVFVNEKKVTIPSYQVRTGDKITLSKKAMENVHVNEAINEEGRIVPGFLKRTKTHGTFERLPALEEVANPVDYQLVVEFYSR